MSFSVSIVDLNLINRTSSLSLADLGKWCLLDDNVFVFMSADLDAVNDMKDSLIREKSKI